ncbi:MAG: cupin domain-containing protein [Pseudomonadota bacterium]
MPTFERPSPWLAACLMAACLVVAGHAAADTASSSAQEPAPGPNRVLEAPLDLTDDLEVIIDEVFLPPNSSLPAHFHPGEDYVYVIEGMVVHEVEGQEPRTYSAGEAFVVRKDVVHVERTLDQPVRAIVFHVLVAGEPLRVPVE